VQLEHAVAVVGLDLILGHALRQGDRPGERAEAALEPVVATVLDRLIALPLGRHRQGVLVQLDGDLVLGDAGQVERIDDLLLRLPDVGDRDPALARAAVPVQQAVHEPAHLVVERGELAERRPSDHRCHANDLLATNLPTVEL
jgi:hypothetical protein